MLRVVFAGIEDTVEVLIYESGDALELPAWDRSLSYEPAKRHITGVFSLQSTSRKPAGQMGVFCTSSWHRPSINHLYPCLFMWITHLTSKEGTANRQTHTIYNLSVTQLFRGRHLITSGHRVLFLKQPLNYPIERPSDGNENKLKATVSSQRKASWRAVILTGFCRFKFC